ncbi:MAG: FAD-dependent oxidoreductase [Clostridia bacterium]|nr:FAD-dependent oxidoreductase [Clostridia bacterium]
MMRVCTDEFYDYVKTVPYCGKYDVLVVGAGPAGICAAISAARHGSKVLLAERYGTVGGMLTSGHVDPILGAVSRGTMYDEIVSRLREKDPDAPQVTSRNGREIPVDKETAKSVLDRMIEESGVILWLGSAFVDVIKENGKVTGAVFATQSGLKAVRSSVTVDATGDGCICAAAGCEIDIGRESDGALQPLTLEFTVSNVDESCAITAWGGTDPVKIPSGEYAGMEYRELCRLKNSEGELPKNVSIVRLHRTVRAGERSVNATQINGCSPLDPQSVAKAEIELRRQIDKCLEFLRRYVPGYENCLLKCSADTVGVRESRRIRGLESVDDNAVEQGIKREDAVVHNAWFLIDIHNPTGGGQAEGHSHHAEPYDIPYGALVPRGVGGLLAAGRCISGTHRAHASYRVMAICMAVGEASGVAASLCAAEGIEPSDLTAAAVRCVLKARGAEL